MKVNCAILEHSFDMPGSPRRIVSLSAGLTEALFAMGCGERVAGVSSYCPRYVGNLAAPVVGDYLRVDEAALEAVDPDLVLVTTGAQITLARRLADRGLPVYALPLPNSLYGILENIVLLGALVNQTRTGRELAARLSAEAADIAASAPPVRPRAYVELWFGRHRRSIGGRTFIHDLVTMAGADPVFGNSPEAYPVPDLADVPALRPDIGIFFQEPDYPVDVPALLRERGWDALSGNRIIESTIQRGRNLIHDGPSLLETAGWLQREILRCLRT
jgi:ABC-type Fe3+-hydroxamate transport system substrate-binding protein